MSSVRLYLLRHGEPHQEPSGGWKFYGHHDIPLSDRGRAQARAQIELLRDVPIHAIYTSDLGRTRWAARCLSEDRDGARVIELPELREMHMGVLEGVTLDEAKIRHPELMSRRYEDMLDWRMPEGGESVRDVHARVVPCLEQLVAAHAGSASEDEPLRIAVFTHNTVNRVLLAHAAGAGPDAYVRFRQRYGAVNRVDLRLDGNAKAAWEEATIVFANLDPQAR